MAETGEALKSFWMRVKEESEKAGSKLNIQKTKIMASGPITSWQTEGEKVEAVIDFIFLGSKITVDGDCSHEMRRCLLRGSKVMTNLDSILRSADITWPKKFCLIKAMFFSAVTYGMWELDQKESWAPKNWCLWIMVLDKTIESPWTARSSNQLVLKEINLEYSLEGLTLKLKLQHFGHLTRRVTHWKTPWCCERLKAKVLYYTYSSENEL